MTQERFNFLMQSGQAPLPEEAADFEMYKALIQSQSLAQNAVAPTPAPAQNLMTPVAPAIPTAPAVPVVTPTPVASNGTFSMDDLMSNKMSVDSYLRVKYQQLLIGDDLVGDQELYVSINLANVVLKMSIKGGSPVIYRSTTDGKTCTSGGSWLAAIEEVQRKSPTAQPYNCADIPMVIAKNVKNFQGNVVASVGAMVGHTTSTTNWRNWVSFYQSLPDDVKERKEEVFVKITRQDIQKKGNSWSVLAFEYITFEQANQLGLVNNPF